MGSRQLTERPFSDSGRAPPRPSADRIARRPCAVQTGGDPNATARLDDLADHVQVDTQPLRDPPCGGQIDRLTGQSALLGQQTQHGARVDGAQQARAVQRAAEEVDHALAQIGLRVIAAIRERQDRDARSTDESAGCATTAPSLVATPVLARDLSGDGLSSPGRSR